MHHKLSPSETREISPSESASLRRPPLGIPESAEYLGTSVRHIRRLISERRVTSYKLGGRVLLNPNDLDELLVKGRREARQ